MTKGVIDELIVNLDNGDSITLFIDKDNSEQEIKQWIQENLPKYLTDYKDNLTERALRYNGARFGQETKAKKADGSEIELKNESEIIKTLLMQMFMDF